MHYLNEKVVAGGNIHRAMSHDLKLQHKLKQTYTLLAPQSTCHAEQLNNPVRAPSGDVAVQQRHPRKEVTDKV